MDAGNSRKFNIDAPHASYLMLREHNVRPRVNPRHIQRRRWVLSKHSTALVWLQTLECLSRRKRVMDNSSLTVPVPSDDHPLLGLYCNDLALTTHLRLNIAWMQMQSSIAPRTQCRTMGPDPNWVGLDGL